MSYQVIARKFRPQNFDEVQGQEHITKTLRRAIETKRIHHAYLFTGGRGVGKTSTARILAKALNCEKGPTPMPCGVCKPCTEITQGINLDVREIDGASNTGVDDIRELRENIRYLPNAGQYRIYIIDEVHMLSTSAFNALLKTLEEPPAHVVFIFATTEPHKILETILSRCQRYDFRLLSHRKIFEQLEVICTREEIKIDKNALHLVAEEAAGSMRDAETLLEQVISYAADTITVEIATQSLGLIDRKVLRETLSALVNRQGYELMKIVRNLHEFGHDIKHFVQDLLRHLRHLSIIKACQLDNAPDQDLLELPDDEINSLRALATKITLPECERLYHLLTQEFYAITHSSNQRIALEMTLLRLVQAPPLTPIQNLIDELRAMKGQGAVKSIGNAQKPAATSLPAKSPAANLTSAAPLWDQLIQALKATNPKLTSALRDLTPISCTPEQITVAISDNAFLQDLFKAQENRNAITETVKKLTGQIPSLEFRISKDLQPLKTESQEQAEERRKLSDSLKNHPLVKDIQSVFGAEIEEIKNLDSRD